MTSKREKIMQHLKERFEGLREDVNGYTTTWNTVCRRPMTKTEIFMGDALGIYDISEEKEAVINFYNCTLTVALEFFYLLQQGDEPSTELNRMLVDIQRAMRSDISCGGLSFNCVENESELDIDGPADRLVAGTVEFRIQYRHFLDDPRQ